MGRKRRPVTVYGVTRSAIVAPSTKPTRERQARADLGFDAEAVIPERLGEQTKRRYTARALWTMPEAITAAVERFVREQAAQGIPVDAGAPLLVQGTGVCDRALEDKPALRAVLAQWVNDYAAAEADTRVSLYGQAPTATWSETEKRLAISRRSFVRNRSREGLRRFSDKQLLFLDWMAEHMLSLQRDKAPTALDIGRGLANLENRDGARNTLIGYILGMAESLELSYEIWSQLYDREGMLRTRLALNVMADVYV